MKTNIFKYSIQCILIAGTFLFSSSGLSAEIIKCSTIAQIKQQADNAEILYTGTATTTFYNGQWSGIFIQDETGGILLKNITMDDARVKTNMKISNLKVSYAVGTSSSAQGIKVISSQDKKDITIISENAEFVPKRISLSEFAENPNAYEYMAVVITDAEVIKDDNKYVLVADDDPITIKSEISTYPPKSGEFAGCYLSYNKRFIIASYEYTNPTSFSSFMECQSFYSKNEPKEGASYSIDGSLIVNYVMDKNDGKCVIFAEYPNNQTTLGITIIVDGSTSVAAGDLISGLKGTYTAPIKDFTSKEFMGGMFYQTKNVDFVVKSNNNNLNVTQDVNISDLVSFKLANDFHAKIIASRFVGKLTLVDGVYKYTVSYEVGSGVDNDQAGGNREMVEAVINVFGANGTDLEKYVGQNVILSGVYDAKVVFADPTLIVRNDNDVVKQHYTFSSIKDMIEFGQPVSKSIVYELTNELVVSYVKTQSNTSGPQTWLFANDETGAIAIDLGSINQCKFIANDKIKGVKGIFNDGTLIGKRISSPRLSVDESVLSKTGDVPELMFLNSTLKDVMADSLRFASRLVELKNVRSGENVITDETGTRTDYFLYETDSKGDTIAVMHYNPALHITQPLYPINTIKGLINYNCLDGNYVIYAIDVIEQKEIQTSISQGFSNCSNIYSVNGTIVVECNAGARIEVYNMQGQKLLSFISSAENTLINNLYGMLIVKIDDIANKIFVK